MQELDLKNCWCVTDMIAQKERFFLALEELVPSDAQLYLYAAATPEAEKTLDILRVYSDFVFEEGTCNPLPSQTFIFEASRRVLHIVSELFINGSISVDHIVVLCNTEILLTFCDAFLKNSNINLSKSLDVGSIQHFCRELGVSLRDSREVYPELFEGAGKGDIESAGINRSKKGVRTIFR